MVCVCVRDVIVVVFLCMYCDAWSCRCSCMGSVSVSSCRCCRFVSCVHPVAVLNAAFCMTCSLLMLFEDARVKVVLFRFSVRWFCFVQTKTVCRYCCMYLFAALVRVCIDVMVMSSA